MERGKEKRAREGSREGERVKGGEGEKENRMKRGETEMEGGM